MKKSHMCVPGSITAAHLPKRKPVEKTTTIITAQFLKLIFLMSKRVQVLCLLEYRQTDRQTDTPSSTQLKWHVRRQQWQRHGRDITPPTDPPTTPLAQDKGIQAVLFTHTACGQGLVLTNVFPLHKDDEWSEDLPLCRLAV